MQQTLPGFVCAWGEVQQRPGGCSTSARGSRGGEQCVARASQPGAWLEALCVPDHTFLLRLPPKVLHSVHSCQHCHLPACEAAWCTCLRLCLHVRFGRRPSLSDLCPPERTRTHHEHWYTSELACKPGRDANMGYLKGHTRVCVQNLLYIPYQLDAAVHLSSHAIIKFHKTAHAASRLLMLLHTHLHGLQEKEHGQQDRAPVGQNGDDLARQHKALCPTCHQDIAHQCRPRPSKNAEFPSKL